MTPIRVLHVLDHSLPHITGYSIRSHYVLGAQREWAVEPLGLTSPKHGPAARNEEIDSIRYLRTPAGAGGRVDRLPVLRELHLMRRLAGRLAQVVREHQPQLVNAHSPVLNGIPALWVARRRGIPIVYEIRTLWEDAAVDHGTHREHSARYRVSRGLESWLIRRVDAVGVISEGLAKDLAQRGVSGKKVFRTLNGVDTERFRPAPRDPQVVQQLALQDKLVVGFIGALHSREGLDLLLQAFATLSARFPHLRALLIGTGESQASLCELVGRLGLAGHVILTGPVEHNHIARYYSACDFLVYPRRSTRSTEHVTPLKPLEAMAAGKAVVASNVGGLRELIRDRETGVLFPAGNADALAEALQELVQDPDLRAALGMRARRYVCEERQWKTVTRGYKQTYDTLLATAKKLA